MAPRRPDSKSPPDPSSGGSPDFAELEDHLAVELAREYVGLLHDRRFPPPAPRPPAPSPEED